jgi:hypothetical protein
VSERTELEQIWRDNRDAWQRLSQQKNVERSVQKMRDRGSSDLVCDLAHIAFVKRDFAIFQTVMALSRMGLDKKDWRASVY